MIFSEGINNVIWVFPDFLTELYMERTEGMELSKYYFIHRDRLGRGDWEIIKEIKRLG